MFFIKKINRLRSNSNEYPILVQVVGVRKNDTQESRIFLFELFSKESVLLVDDSPVFDVPSKQEVAICRVKIFKLFDIQEPKLFSLLRKKYPDRSFPVSVIAFEVEQQLERSKRCQTLSV